MINVNGERKRPLGEVLDFPITIKGVTIPIDAVVTDAMTYSAIVRNDWLAKVKANIDYNTSTMMIHWEGKEIEVPIECWEMPMERRKRREEEGESEDEEEEEDEVEKDETEEEEYEDEDLDENVFCHFKLKQKTQKPKVDLKIITPPRLECNISEVVTGGIYPTDDFSLTNKGARIGRSFYTWDYFF